ncbi:cation-transporting ATPase E [Arthrobacter sp. V1I9]|uniref:HAD-IC family P-type ATPase n=1 Tax=Arthrobacter sp. V1I9 TaxID=3042275 RepID=UPI0027946893|nr:HAD-IC family P-type ATPase [Arthrobacter sp. V1I9]MDQ0867826.1 cation-transporting ATPase E [Arthrobacter sp. V1I9]
MTGEKKTAVLQVQTAVPILGLSAGDVAARVKAGSTNLVPDFSSRSLWDIFRANVLTLFNGIVAGSFLLLLLLGQWRDALFGFAAVSNALIGVVQEYRAKKSLDRLAVLNSPRARVLRGGVVQDIDVEDVVQDDVLVLRAGDQVAADAVVLDAEGLEIDESLLTGESDPVGKGAGTEVLSGSSVVSGQGRAAVIRVGAESFASRLTVEAKRFSLVHSEIRAGLNRVLRWITVGLLPIMAIVINAQMQGQGGWQNAITTGNWRVGAVGAVASVIAMIPLGLVLMTSVAFAVGAVRLARQKVLIQELAAVEGLARVDVLCLDKTGTLTVGKIIFDAFHNVGTVPPAGWNQVLGWFGADPNANATARCLADAFPHSGSLRPLSSVPFSSARKWSAVTFATGTLAEGTWLLGAPEMVLDPETAGAGHALDLAATLATTGLRTLVLAHAPATTWAGSEDPVLPAAPVPTALLTFREKVRPDAAQTLSYFKDQDVGLRIISGDDPRTVAAVAREVGVPTNGGYDARQLPTDPGELAEVMEQHTVFGRVTPAQKKDMVRALQARGHVVAMTGDGVNDALALKEADIGIAMDSAAAATKAVSRLVLLDGRFDRLPGVVAEGRQVIANIERVSMLFLTKTAYAVILSITFGALLWEFPFLPRQFSATDGITIGIPAFFLALMPNARRYEPGFLKRSLSFAVPAGLITALAVLAINTYSRQTGSDTPAARTGSVLVLTLITLWVLVVLSRPLNSWRLVIIGAMYAGLILLLTLPLPQDFFGFVMLGEHHLTASLVAGLLGALAIEFLFRFHRRGLRTGSTPA